MSNQSFDRCGKFRGWFSPLVIACLLLCTSMSDVAIVQAQIADRPWMNFSDQADAKQSTLNSKLESKLIQLLGSKTRDDKLVALEALKQVQPTLQIEKMIKTICEESDDAIVVGYARLLAADWGLEIRKQAVAFNFNDLNKKVESPVVDGQVEAASLNAQLSSVAQPKNSQVSQNQMASSVSPQATPIGISFSDQPGTSSLIPVDANFSDRNFAPSATEVADGSVLAATSFLKPQAPFWATQSSVEESVPADSELFKTINLSDESPFNDSTNEMKIESGLTDQPSVGFKLSDSDFNSLDELGKPRPPNAIRPEILDRKIDETFDPAMQLQDSNVSQAGYLSYDRESPLGFTGRSGVMPTEFQTSDHFVPIEDRWRIGFPEWDRYGKGHPVGDDYPYKQGSLWDPYNQNVLKGDFPIIGQHTFYSMTAESLAVHEFRQTPTATTPFESTNTPFSGGFFGDPNQIFYTPYFKFTFELFHGNEAFKPVDWKFRIMPVFNLNYLDVEELAVVNPDVRLGTNRYRDDAALEEWFVEAKLADIGPDYDFVSARVGSQFFVSDFRGFIFRDVNRAVRLFGTRLANRDQFNLVWFDQAEKDTNSELNTFRDRHQNVVVANYYRQDFIFPGYVAQASFHYNNDQPSFEFDDNNNLVRPDPVGNFKEHEVNAYYVGLAGEGHIGRINVVNQVYVALGEDSANPIGSTSQEINAQMAALELSYDRDWIRFRTSYFYSSGDDDPNDGKAEGFDTILDDPIFAGGEFSYWQRQSIRLFGNNLVQRKSIVPNLRSSKAQGQSNFVNPGLHLFNIGMDLEITPKSRVIANANYLYFDETAVLETYTFQDKINREIGTDLSLGLEYRPFLNDNAIIVLGIATLLPDEGLEDLFGTQLPQELIDIGVGNELRTESPRLTSAFVELVLTY